MMNELIIIEKQDVMSTFTQRDLITPLLAKIEHAATKETLNATTDQGRKAIASMAYRVAQSKTYIESHGKDLAAELKELPKLVDSNRKYARDFLDALKERIRKPLDVWEAEQAAILLAAKVLVDHAEAVLCNIEWELAKKSENDRIEKERADYEARILMEAETRAKFNADERIRREVINAESRALSAELEIKRVQAQAQHDIEQAGQRATQEAQSAQEHEARNKREQEQVKAKAKLQLDNVTLVRQSIIDDLKAIGLNEKQANYILKAVIKNKIRALRVEY